MRGFRLVDRLVRGGIGAMGVMRVLGWGALFMGFKFVYLVIINYYCQPYYTIII